MAREYPRFLYSNPKDTKSKGPFVVHTLYPALLCKINLKSRLENEYLNKVDDYTTYISDTLTVELLKVYDNDVPPNQIKKILSEIGKWVYQNKVKK